ncbi:ORF39 [Ranid herpesvirus 1]|uniref:ORF39 n=1 Tax=Ranid herpesvirus 1 TaxID=85655 RepID=Q14VR9_9VIRU|nr:ORF39 [Ranid herpesvirus 1]ABG25796.1 ORF39 [Ranid herpesvirus 1]
MHKQCAACIHVHNVAPAHPITDLRQLLILKASMRGEAPGQHGGVEARPTHRANLEPTKQRGRRNANRKHLMEGRGTGYRLRSAAAIARRKARYDALLERKQQYRQARRDRHHHTADSSSHHHNMRENKYVCPPSPRIKSAVWLVDERPTPPTEKTFTPVATRRNDSPQTYQYGSDYSEEDPLEALRNMSI